MIQWQAHPTTEALTGEVRVPSDKSITHRALMLGGLAHGTTKIYEPLLGADAISTLRAMEAFGARSETTNELISIEGAHKLNSPSQPIDCGNAGTLIRLLAGAICGRDVACVLDGDKSLRSRPMRRITEPLTQMGAQIFASEEGTPPLRIEPVTRLRQIKYTLTQASAQVKSAVLLAGLCADEGAAVIEKLPTRNHTELMLPSFGVDVEIQGNQIKVAPGELQAATVHVPADISSAAFYMVAASVIPESDVLLRDVGINPTRAGVIKILDKMGAKLEIHNERMLGNEPIADIRVTSSALHGINLHAKDVPSAIDELPVIFVAACYANGIFRIRGAGELRAKESDRLSAMGDALQKLGIQAVEYDDGIDIIGDSLVQGGTVNSCGDHRIAMAMAVAALKAKEPIVIEDCANVGTSFPYFRQLAETIGWNITENDAN